MTRVLAVLAAMLAAPVLAQPGTIVAVGGALADDNAAVFRAMIEAMPDDSPTIAVIPAASGYPGGAAARFADALALHGVDRARIVAVSLALVDDPDTADIDESRWREGALDAGEIAKITRAGLIWFAGGDQARIMAALVAPDGSDTPMLAAIRQRLDRGAVVGGTSAGAAVLGEHMIGCGSVQIALVAPVSRDLGDCAGGDEASATTPLVLTRGLGFLPDVVFDQHFSERGRLVRLVRAVACIDEGPISGIGVDEDTGFVFSLARDVGETFGRGTVTLLDPSASSRSCAGAVMDNVRLTRIAGTPAD